MLLCDPGSVTPLIVPPVASTVTVPVADMAPRFGEPESGCHIGNRYGDGRCDRWDDQWRHAAGVTEQHYEQPDRASGYVSRYGYSGDHGCRYEYGHDPTERDGCRWGRRSPADGK